MRAPVFQHIRLSLQTVLRVLALSVLLTACTTAPLRPSNADPLPPCGSFPNCVNSMAAEGGRAIEPLQATPEQWQALRQHLAQQPAWSIEDTDEFFIQAVVTSAIMRYRDDVQLQFHPDQHIIHVRSSSRLGIGDMGANRDRMEALREFLKSS